MGLFDNRPQPQGGLLAKRPAPPSHAPSMGNFTSNLAAMPGQMLGGAKAVGNFLTSGTQAAGQDIAGAILPYTKDYQDAIKHASVQGSNLDPTLKKSNLAIAGDFANMGAEALGGGSFSKAGLMGSKALTTGLQKTGAPLAAQIVKGTANAIAPKSTAAKILDMVSPRLTKAVAEASKVTDPKGIMGKISVIAEERTKQVADVVKGVVSPRKTFSQNANRVFSAISTEAKSLVSNLKAADLNTPVSVLEKNVEQLSSKLDGMERPILISTDVSLDNAFTKAIEASKKILQEHGGTTEGMLAARKAFDELAQEQFPKVFDDVKSSALTKAIKDARQVINDFIAQKAPTAAVKDSLHKQSLLYDAFDVLKDKAAAGAPTKFGEIGSNRFGRAAANHPAATGLLKGTAKTIGTGLGIGAVGGGIYEGAKILGQ